MTIQTKTTSKHNSQEYFVSKGEFDMTVNGLREDVTQLRISVGKIETRVDGLEKAIDKLTAKVDGFTWRLVLGLVGVVAAQVILFYLSRTVTLK
jgi:hypothetical protein